MMIVVVSLLGSMTRKMSAVIARALAENKKTVIAYRNHRSAFSSHPYFISEL